MCGGKILNIPCSHIGHNYKGSGFHPYTSNGSFIWPNLNRIAEVWMDEYKEQFYLQTGSRHYDTGDLTKQFALRKSLKCKPFKWYLENILPDIFDIYPIDMSKMLAYGVVSHI